MTTIGTIFMADEEDERGDSGLAGMVNASWRFIQAIYKVPGARSLFDVVGVHPYTHDPHGVITILNAAPEAYAGGGLARLRTGDRVRVDLRRRRVDALVPEAEWQARAIAPFDTPPVNATPWQQIHRSHVGQLHTGACFDFACAYRDVCRTVPRHNH